MSEDAIAVVQDNKKPVNPWIITTAVMLATFVAALNSSIANVALRQIGGSFSATQDESLWIVTSYLVASSVLLPATAWFSSIFGRKKFFLGCLAIFAIASFLCGVSVNMTMMILARIMQGVGGGVLLPLSQAILFETFPKEKYGLAMSVFGVGVVFAPIIGPLVGGWLTTDYSWNWAFFISIPFCMIAFIMVQMFIHDPPYMEAKGLQKIDYAGFLILITWLASFQVMLDNGQKNGWFGSSKICWLGSIALISFIGLIAWELKNKTPLIDLKIFKNWNFSVGTGIYTVIFMILYGTMAILPLFTQSLLGYTSFLSGLAVAPMGIGSLIGITITAILSDKMDMRKMAACGLILSIFACFLFANLNLSISLMNIVIPNIVIGTSFPLIINPLTTLIFANVKNEDMTNASGLQNLMKNIGGAIGTSLVGVMVSRYSQIHQHYLVDKLTPLNPVFEQKVNALTMAFAQQGNIVVAKAKANYMLYGLMQKQAVLCAYMDSYKVYAVIMLCLIPLLFLIKKVTYKK